MMLFRVELNRDFVLIGKNKDALTGSYRDFDDDMRVIGHLKNSERLYQEKFIKPVVG